MVSARIGRTSTSTRGSGGGCGLCVAEGGVGEAVDVTRLGSVGQVLELDLDLADDLAVEELPQSLLAEELAELRRLSSPPAIQRQLRRLGAAIRLEDSDAIEQAIDEEGWRFALSPAGDDPAAIAALLEAGAAIAAGRGLGAATGGDVRHHQLPLPERIADSDMQSCFYSQYGRQGR